MTGNLDELRRMATHLGARGYRCVKTANAGMDLRDEVRCRPIRLRVIDQHACGAAGTQGLEVLRDPDISGDLDVVVMAGQDDESRLRAMLEGASTAVIARASATMTAHASRL